MSEVKVTGVFHLEDTPKNRDDNSVWNKNEILTSTDKGCEFWNLVDAMLQWGRTYKITVEEVEGTT